MELTAQSQLDSGSELESIPESKLSKINFKRWFALFVGLHLFLWTLLPSLVRATVANDTLEGIVWGWQWQLGYNKHPPLAAWLTALFTNVFGTVGWPVYLLAQLAVVLAFWAIWRLALRITTPLYALISVFSLEGIIYFNRVATKFTPDTVQTPIWALMMLMFYLVLTEKKLWQWIVLGLLAGLAIWGKYQAPILFVPMILLLLVTEKGRACFKQIGLYLAGIIAVAITIPHFIWAYHNHFPEIGYALNSTTGTLHLIGKDTFDKSHFLNPLKMISDQLGAIAGFLIIFSPFYWCPRAKSSTIKSPTKFDITFLSFIALGPFVLTLLFSLFTGSFLIGRWCMPYFSALALWAIILLRPEISWRRFQWFFGLFLFIAIGTLVGRYTWLGYIEPYWTNSAYSDAYFPAKPIATWTTNYWHKHYHEPLKYIAGDHYLISYVVPYSKDRPDPLMGWNEKESEWMNLNKFRQHGGMLLWMSDKVSKNTLPERAKRLFPDAKLLPKHYFYKLTAASHLRNDPVYIGFAVVPPKTSSSLSTFVSHAKIVGQKP